MTVYFNVNSPKTSLSTTQTRTKSAPEHRKSFTVIILQFIVGFKIAVKFLKNIVDLYRDIIIIITCWPTMGN